MMQKGVAMKFEKNPPEWHNAGVEPAKELKQEGFKAGYKPPASYFNWFWNRVSNCLKEIQTIIINNGKVLIGDSSTDLSLNDTLFLVEPDSYSEARITNLSFDKENLQETENLGTTREVTFLEGKLTVAERPNTETTFYANTKKGE